jgi:hypothetical protein
MFKDKDIVFQMDFRNELNKYSPTDLNHITENYYMINRTQVNNPEELKQKIIDSGAKGVSVHIKEPEDTMFSIIIINTIGENKELAYKHAEQIIQIICDHLGIDNLVTMNRIHKTIKQVLTNMMAKYTKEPQA